MANCHNLFTDYDDQLKLSDSRKEGLKVSRATLRDEIRTYFKEIKPDEIQPKFKSQGSFVMGTIINPTPIEEDGKKKYKYDMDDGVYFIGNEDANKRKSCVTYHQWIIEAVSGHTEKTIDKNTCVRVVFSDGHHIDLPIYYKKGEVPELAHKEEGWIKSDPQEFIKWFNNKQKENSQLERLVRYMKGWADARKSKNSSQKMPSGLILTILTANNIKSNSRDDIAMKDTLNAINIELKLNGVRCLRPTTPSGEDLFKDYSQSRKDDFKSQLEKFLESAKQAIEEPNQKDACAKWQKHLGDRFPCHKAEDKIEDAKAYPAPAVIRANAGSA